MTISSHHNPQLAEVRRLTGRRDRRDRTGRFVAEGEDVLAAADAAGWVPVRRFCAAGSGLPGIEVEPSLLAAASGLGSGTRALAVYEERWASAAAGPLCVHLHAVGDPGNVGTILRSAEAFGAASVSIGPGTADPYSPRAVRASMGAVFTVALARVSSVAQLPSPTVALCAGRGTPLDQLRLEGASLLIGSERDGLPDELIAGADHVARIPVANHSLNAAMAATVALYEMSRMARL
ncbi:MAG: TrmH family RNA methyltransferase [Solirubrobacteraceae bacterium]